MAKNIEFFNTIIQRAVKANSFEKCMKQVKIMLANEGRCKAEFTVADEHLNLGGFMHGGFTSTLVDCVSSYALMTQGTGAPGVSVDLHVSFMKPALPGDLVTVDAKTIRVGKTLAFLGVEITKNNGKDLIAHGSHTKFLV